MIVETPWLVLVAAVLAVLAVVEVIRTVLALVDLRRQRAALGRHQGRGVAGVRRSAWWSR